MKDIDLTKCVNCWFRAKVDGKEVEGRIAVAGDYLQFFYNYGNESCYSMLISYYREHGADYFDDFELVPRDPETYRDWQVGDSLKCVDLELEVIFRSGKLVVISDPAKDSAEGVWTYNELFRSGYRLVLTDIERQIIEERKKYEPQDGDVCYLWTLNGSFVFIFRNSGDAGSLYDHISFALDTNHLYVSPQTPLLTRMDNNTEFRPATEDEKQKLFDAMAKAGMLWNAEKKVVEDIPKPYEFKKGEPVLVRDRIENRWQLGAFCWINENDEGFPFVVGNGLVGGGFKYCLPYNERTMHLLGTTEDYKEE